MALVRTHKIIGQRPGKPSTKPGRILMTQSLGSRISVRSILVALVAGIAFAMTEMVIGAIWGKGFWSPLRFIASIFTLGKDTDPSFSLGPVLVGAAGHMIDSVVLGLIFIVLVGRITGSFIGLVLAGIIFGTVIFAGSWFVILPLIDPAMLLLNGPGFLASHTMFGLFLAVGTWLAWERMVAAKPIPAPR